MKIQRIENYNNSFGANLEIIGYKKLLSRKQIAEFKMEAKRFAHEKDSIVVNIGRLNPHERTRSTVIDINVNGTKIQEKCDKLFDYEVRDFIIKFFEELNKPV